MSRIYLVKDLEAEAEKLVRAHNAAQALRHVAINRLSVAVASQDDLVELLAMGHKVENASRDDVMPASQSGLVNTKVQQ